MTTSVGTSGRVASDLFTYVAATSVQWSQLVPAVSPSARTGAAMAYDAARNQVVLFGGISGQTDLTIPGPGAERPGPSRFLP